MWDVESGIWDVESGTWNVECRMWKVESGRGKWKSGIWSEILIDITKDISLEGHMCSYQTMGLPGSHVIKLVLP